MKKTLTVNLGGTVYHIDEDAYRLLDNYLCNLRLHFRKQKGADEIVNDIEIRISELFAEKVSAGKQVITISDVDEVIVRMGKPEDFCDMGDDTDTGKGFAHTGSTYAGSSTTNRCLYRDPDNRMLGGVASGFAAYLGWDVTLVRILMIVLAFVPYCPMIILYLIGWIVIPEARTAAEKLNMRGEEVTIENIGKTVTDGFERMADGVNDYVRSGKPRTILQQVADGLVTVAGFVFKIFLVALFIVCCPVLFVLAILFVALVIVAIAAAIGGGALLYNMLPAINWEPLASISPVMTVAGTMAGVAMIGIPLASVVYLILRQLFHWPPMATGLKWTLLILWFLGVAIFVINLYALGWQLPLYGLHPI